MKPFSSFRSGKHYFMQLAASVTAFAVLSQTAPDSLAAFFPSPRQSGHPLVSQSDFQHPLIRDAGTAADILPV